MVLGEREGVGGIPLSVFVCVHTVLCRNMAERRLHRDTGFKLCL